jgi:type III secretory pathway component EscV
MPGKQMAIDADMNAGLIGEEEAKKRRAEVTQEADFYGSMDGALITIIISPAMASPRTNLLAPSIEP